MTEEGDKEPSGFRLEAAEATLLTLVFASLARSEVMSLTLLAVFDALSDAAFVALEAADDAKRRNCIDESVVLRIIQSRGGLGWKEASKLSRRGASQRQT
jgi:hypothetical protein